jgi:predicted dehydrogenase
MNGSTRREFLARGSAAALSVPLARGPSRQVSVGVIGPGGMGSAHVATLAPRTDVAVTVVCDPDEGRAAAAARAVEQAGQKAPAVVKDLRRMLDDKSVEAVFIATPDHWHGPATILACDAGKHVYVEKPCSHNIREGRLMVEAARRNKRVVQVGTQSRSTETVMAAMEALRKGEIGEILAVKAWNSQLRGSIGRAKPEPPPPNLDFDLWLGPAPQHPYQRNLLPGAWRWWRAFGTGDIGNDGVHNLDVGLWGLGLTTHPSRIAALGGKYFQDDDNQFPDTQYVVYEYEAPAARRGKIQYTYEQRLWSPYHQEGYENGNAFYGTEGQLVIGHTVGWKIIRRGDKPGPHQEGGVNLRAHHDDFFQSIKDGRLPNADIEMGHRAATLAHLGNIAVRVGRALTFDPVKEQIVGDPEANAQVRRAYREGHWAVPKGV